MANNLHVLRTSLAAENVDLIYLGPLFNSKCDYNLLFKSPGGTRSRASQTSGGDPTLAILRRSNISLCS